MTFVGKVLVVVNVVLTVCIAMFAAGVFAVQTSWRDKHNSLLKLKTEGDEHNSQQVAGKDTRITELNEQKTKASDAAGLSEANYQREITGRAADAAKHKDTIADCEKKVSVYAVLDQDNQTKQKELDNLRIAMTNLHKKLKTLSDDVTKLEDDKYGLQRQGKLVARKYNAMLETLVTYRKILNDKGISFVPAAAAVAGRDVIRDPAEGIVTDVLHGSRTKATLVEVSVGSDDRVIIGSRLHVFRLDGKGKYLGKIKITKVTADTAIGELVDNAKQGLIKKGDHVAAKLK